MNRPLKLSMLVALALTSTQVLALGLGQIQVKSTLNKPLLVEIPLQLDYAGEADQVRVALATPEDFARAGINRSQLTVPLNFAVVTNAQGQKVVRVTSSEPVSDPYLDFLIQVNWPKGRMLREYTVLLDPPNMPAATPMTAPAAAPMRAPMQAPTPMQAPMQQSRPMAAPAPSSNDSASRIHDGHYGPVQAGESLSQIANATRMSGVSFDQMMVALKNSNPDAFYRDNINALKRGAVLRIPSKAEAQAQTADAAKAAAHQQNMDWRNGAAAAPATVAGAGAATTTAASAGAGNAGDHLALVPPGPNGKSANSAGNSAALQSLNQELARNKENLSNAKQQNDVLESRVKDLEQISDKNKRLLDMKDAQIAQLQQQLAKSGQAPANSAAPTIGAMAASKAATPAPVVTTSDAMPPATPDAAKANATQPSDVAKPVVKPAASRPAPNKPVAMHKKPAHAVAPAPTEMPWYKRTWVLVAGGAILLLLILGALFGRRRDAVDESGKSSLSDHFGASPLGDDAADGAHPDHVFDAEAEMEADQRQLLEQLAENPDDIGLHLELASLYYARHDVEGFEGAAEAMYAHVSNPQQPEWLDVVAMGQELAPGHPLFGGYAADTVSTDEHEALDEFDVDAYAPEVPGETYHTDGAPSEASTYSYDFNLSPNKSAAAAAESDSEEALAFEHGTPEHADDIRVDDHAATAFANSSTPSVETDELGADHDLYTDDPVDTKLDLARAYMDMGDHDGARSMLEEVSNEGNQMQKDVAKRLLDELS